MSYLGFPTGSKSPDNMMTLQDGSRIVFDRQGYVAARSAPTPMPFAPATGGIGSGTAGIDPAVARGLQAGQQMHWTEAQSAVNDATARLGNAYMGEGIPDASMAMPYLMRANEKGRGFQVAVNSRDAEIHRLGMVAADPRGADLYARFEAGEIPGYQITGDPGVSPYWKKRVVEQSMRERKDPAIYGRAQLPGSSSRAGMAPMALADEALGQMMRAADRMSNGRGGAALRRAVASYAAALAGGDETTIDSARSMLGGMLGGMMSRFQDRVDKESGVAGMVDVKERFFRELDARIAGRSAGPASTDGARPQMGGGVYGERDSQSATGTRGGAASAGRSGSPGRPTLAPNGMRVHEFATRDHFIEEVKKGRVVGNGELVVMGGRPYVAVPGRDSQDLVPAMVFGSTAIPDPGLYGGGAAGVRQWSSTLDDEQRQAVLADLTANPETRAGLSGETLDKLNMVVRSRQGLLHTWMSPRDREAAAAKLREDEDAAIHAAIVGMVGSRGATNARTLAAMQEESRQDEADDKARNAADQKLSGDAPPTQESRRPLGKDGEDVLSSGGGPQADEMVGRTWQSMQPSLRRGVDRMLSVLSTMEFPADPASKNQTDMTLLSNMEMRRLLVQAERGATEMELVSMVDRMRPGFAAAYYGPTSQSATDLASEWARFSRTPMGDDQSLMKMWSFLTLFDATGQWPEQSMQQHWQGLPESARASASAYASHARRAAATPQQGEPRPAATPQAQQQAAPTPRSASTPQTGLSRQSRAASTTPTPPQTARSAARVAASEVADEVSQYARTGIAGGIVAARQVAMAVMEGSSVVAKELRDAVNREIERREREREAAKSPPPEPIELDPEGAARFNLARATNLVGPDSPSVTGKVSTGTASEQAQVKEGRRAAAPPPEPTAPSPEPTAPSPEPRKPVLAVGEHDADYEAAVSEQVDRWRRMPNEEKLRYAEEIARMVVELERLNMRRR